MLVTLNLARDFRGRIYATGNPQGSTIQQISLNINPSKKLEHFIIEKTLVKFRCLNEMVGEIEVETHVDPKSTKKTVKLSSFLHFWDLRA